MRVTHPSPLTQPNEVIFLSLNPKGRFAMSLQLMLATGTISLAFVLYTVGVFWERAAGRLRLPHLVVFWCGLVFDTLGTTIMTGIAGSGASLGAAAGGPNLHGITGALAIVLMLFHASWATVTYVRRSERRLASFHRLSIAVWLVWTLPYAMGLLMGIPAIHMDGALAFVHALAVTLFLAAVCVLLPAALRGRAMTSGPAR